MTGTRSRGFGDALGQVFTNDYPTWSVGLTVSYPLGHSFEEASLARADVERRQAAQRIASLRVQAAETVRRAGRQVRSTAERVDAARAGATLARGAPAVGAAPLRGRAVDDVPRDAGAARPAARRR